MYFSFENPLKMFCLLYVLNVIGTPVLYVTCTSKTAFKFISAESGDGIEHGNSREIDDTL